MSEFFVILKETPPLKCLAECIHNQTQICLNKLILGAGVAHTAPSDRNNCNKKSSLVLSPK